MSTKRDTGPAPEATEEVVRVRISTLVLEGSPRALGEDEEHVRALAAVEDELPPIIVHRSTMRVIDGAHRVRAAMLGERKFIAARYFDGSAEDAFVLAVRANVGHGLPLSLKDRLAAAERIIVTHPAWSNRMIATASGVAARTVAEIRRRMGDDGQCAVRIGRDGRARPTDGERRRSLASSLLTENPDLSLRQVAHLAGVSPETVRTVRNRLLYGRRPANPLTAPAPRPTAADHSEMLRKLAADPAVRQTDVGRLMVRLLHVHLRPCEDWERIVAHVPPHCSGLVEQLARECARRWSDVAARVSNKAVRGG